MVEQVHNRLKKEWADADADWVTGDYRMLLLRGALVQDPDDVFVSDVLAAPNTELTDASYGRVALGSKTVTQNDASDRADLDAADVDFTTLDLETPTAAVIFRQVTTDADSPVAAFFTTGFGAAANGAGYVVETPNDVIRIT